MHYFRQKYYPLPHADECDIEKEPRVRQQSSRCWPFILRFLFAAFLVAAVAAVSTRRMLSRCLNTLPSQHSAASVTEMKNCGSSPAEARGRGCRFDFLSFAWQIPECYDGELIDEFRYSQNWTFYRDAEGQEPVALEMAAEGEMDMLYARWEFHRVHCKYMWTQMHRALLNNRPMDSHLNSFEHTVHCGEVLRDDGYVEKGRMSTQTPIIYPACELGRRWVSGAAPELLKQSGLA